MRMPAVIALACLLLPSIAKADILILSEPGFQSSSAQNNATNLGIPFGTISYAGLAAANPATLLSNYGAIYVPPSQNGSQYNSLRSLVAPGGVIEQFVQMGGVAAINVAGNSGNQADVLPTGVDYVRTIHDSGFSVDASHPFIEGLAIGGTTLTANDNFNSPNNWNNTSHGSFTNTPGGTTVIVNHANGPMMLEFGHGAGLVVGSALTFGWGSQSAQTVALDNLLLYINSAQNQTVPEPTTIAVWSLVSVIGAAAARRRRRSPKT